MIQITMEIDFKTKSEIDRAALIVSFKKDNAKNK